MKRFALLIAVVSLCASGLAAQTISQNEGVTVGPNTVEVTARHADGTVFYHHVGHNLKTTWGIDEIANCLSYTGNTCGAYPLTQIQLSTDTGAPAAGDCITGPCTLTGVITTNGLSAAIATYAHTLGTSTYTLTHTWTATGTVTAVQKAAISNGAIVGNAFAFENTFSPVTLNTNDQLQLVWTITIS